MGVTTYKCEVCSEIIHSDDITLCPDCYCYICVFCCPYEFIESEEGGVVSFKNGCDNCKIIKENINENNRIKEEILKFVCKSKSLKVKNLLDKLV